jgi:hypothetical protein
MRSKLEFDNVEFVANLKRSVISTPPVKILRIYCKSGAYRELFYKNRCEKSHELSFFINKIYFEDKLDNFACNVKLSLPYYSFCSLIFTVQKILETNLKRNKYCLYDWGKI